MRKLAVAAAILVGTSCAVLASIGGINVSIVNNSIPAGGYLLDNSAGFLTNGAGQKILAR